MGLRERLKRLEALLAPRKERVFEVILEDDVPPEGKEDEGAKEENRATGEGPQS